MSRTVDERIVEMKFDNAQFEKNVATSMSTLDKLKAALKLDGASKGLDDVSKSTKGLDPSISAISKSVEALEKRFSAFGIVGMEVIRKITDAALNFAGSVMSKITDSIIGGGVRRAKNIEQAHFQLQGLIKDEEKVQYIMSQAMDSVDGTAYGYDVAAKAASMFYASGIKEGKMMETSLAALAGTTAMTGRSYDDIAHIFTTVAGQGRIMGEQLNQFASSGLNVAATLAQYYREVKGEVDMTEQGIRDLISDKKTNIYFEEFAEAMNWAFGTQAKKANETFNGSLDNIKAALSRVGAKFISPLIVQNGELVKLFNAIRIRINDINKLMDPFANKFTSVVRDAASSLTKFLNSESITHGISETMPKLFKIFDNLVISAQYSLRNFASVLTPITQGLQKFIPYDILDRIENFTNKIRLNAIQFKLSDETVEKLRYTFQGVSAIVHIVGKSFGTLLSAASPLTSVLKAIGSVFLTITSNVGQFLVGFDKFLFGVKDSTSGLSFFEEVVKNVGNGFKSLFEQISKVQIPFNKFITDSQKARAMEALSKIVTKLKDAFLNLTRSFSNINIFNNLQNGVNKTADSISSFTKGPIESFIQALERIADSDFKFPTTLTDAKNLFAGFVKTVVDGCKQIVDALIGVGSQMKSAFNPTNDIMQNASDRFKKITGASSTALDDQGNIFKKIFTGISIAFAGKMISELIKSLSKFMDIGNKLAGSASKISKSWSRLMDSFAFKAKASVIKEIAVSIGILAGSLWLIAGIPANDLDRATEAMKNLAVGLGALFYEFAALNKAGYLGGEGMANISKVMLTMVASIGALVLVMKQFEGYDYDDIFVGLIGIGGAAATLLVSIELLENSLDKFKHWSGKTFNAKFMTFGQTMLMIAGAIAILSIPIKSLAELDFPQLANGLIGVAGGMGILVGALAVLGLVYKEFKTKNETMIAAAGAMIMMASAMTILSIPIKSLAELEWGELGRGLTGVSVGMLAMAAALKVATASFKGIGASAGQLIAAGAAMVLMATAMTELIIPITILGAIPWDVMVRGLGAVVVGLGTMALALRLASFSGGANALGAGVGMMAVAAAMNMLLPVVIAFGVVPWPIIAQGLTLFVAGLAGFAVVGLIATAASEGLLALGGALLMIAGAIAVAGVGIGLIGAGFASLAAGLLALSTISTTAAQSIVNAITTIASGLLGMVPKIADNLLKATVSIIDTILEAIIMCAPKLAETVSVLAVSAIAAFVTTYPAFIEGVLTLVDAILTALVEHTPSIIDKLFSWIIQIIDGISAKIPTLMGSIGNLIMSIVTTIVDAINSLTSSSIQYIVEFAGILSAFLLACAGLATLAPVAAVGIVAFGALVTELTIVLAAVGAINKIPGLKEFVDSGGELLQAVGSAIGNFIGGFVGGVVEGVSASLPGIATNLSDFMTNIEPFITGASRIPKDLMGGVGALVEAILAITAASVINGIMTFLGGGISFVTFGIEIVALGTAISAFAKTIDGINADKVEKAVNAAKILTAVVNNLPREGGLIGGVIKGIMGSHDMNSFADQLEGFGKAIARFSDAVDGKVNATAVEAAANAGKVVAEMAKSIPNSGGLLGKIFGENDMNTFSEGLKKFGKAIAAYSRSVDGKINQEAVEASARAGTMMAELADSIPNSGGIIGVLAGNNDLDQFGKNLVYYGSYLVAYSDEVLNLNTEAIDKSATATTKLVEIANALGIDGGILQNIIGGQSLSRFGAELVSFGNNLSLYSGAVTNLNISAIDNSCAQIRKIVDLAKEISNMGTNVFAEFSQGLITMAQNGINAFINSFNGSTIQVETTVTKFINTVKQSIENLTPSLLTTGVKAGEQIGTGLTQGLNNKTQLTITAANTLCDEIIKVFKTKIVESIWSDLGKTIIMESLIKGIENNRTLLITTVANICNDILKKFQEIIATTTFRKYGSDNVMKSLIDGINSKRDDLNKLIKKICEDIVKTFKNNLKDKTFHKIGEDIIKALIDGLKKTESKTKLQRAVKEICDTIVKEFQKLTKNSSDNEFYKVGKNITEGLAKGIQDSGSKKQVNDAIKKVIKEAVDAAKSESKEKSPSKVFAEIGKFFDLGLVEGIDDYSGDVSNSTSRLAKSAIDSMRQSLSNISDLVNDELDYTPTITPVIDLSNIQNGSKRMRGLITKGLNTSLAYNNALLTSIGSNSEIAKADANGNATISNNYNFTQNNYSPKALSRKEIYRQTRNQFSALKGAVSGT